MAESAILYDSSKCSACKGCQVQCKQWNMLPSRTGKNDNEYTGTYQSMSDLDGNTRLLITFDEKATEKGIEWAFGRRACFHCAEPACAAACPQGAITKQENGSVKLDRTKCIGCKYCTAACPFEIPKYSHTTKTSNKCTMCDDRIANGREPACVQTCPAAALSFGDRDAMIAQGQARVDELKNAGFDKAELYGVDQMGGMHSLFVAKYGFEAHGLIRDPKPTLSFTLFKWLKPLTGLGVVGVAAVMGVSFLTGIGYKRDAITAPSATKEEN